MDPIELADITNDIYAGPFHGVQRASGADFYEDLGNLWTRSFGDPVAEYWAVRRDAGLWDVSALVKFRLTGSDALAALDHLTTRKVSDASPGSVRYGMVLDEHGRMLDEGTSLIVSAGEAYFFGNDDRPPFVEHLECHTADLDVRIENVSQAIPNIAVQGPRSFALLSGLCDTDFADLRWFRFIPAPVRIAGVSGLLVRAGFTGELGYEFYLLDGGEGAETLWNAIVEAGASPIGLDAIEKLRVEAGLVIQEEDYWVGKTDPYDLSLDAFIETGTHEFIGRDACAAAESSPQRRFVTLAFEGEEPPQAGAPVSRDGAVVGDVRSAEHTPRFGTLGLSVVRSPFAVEGTQLEVEGRAAIVKPLPIDDPKKERPRADPRTPLTV